MYSLEYNIMSRFRGPQKPRGLGCSLLSLLDDPPCEEFREAQWHNSIQYTKKKTIAQCKEHYSIINI